MGLDLQTAEFLLHCKNLGVDFERTCTLGRQTVKLHPSGKKALKKWTAGKANLDTVEFAEPFFTALGATQTFAIDSSSYEGADIIYNLNDNLPAELAGKFSCLIDGGTLEHIFDFPSALAKCMSMVSVGGHLIICNMANNCMGHGFYQLSPELFYSSLTFENGYDLKAVLLYESRGWFECYNPAKIGCRVQAATKGETYIFVCAKRVSGAVPLSRPPHQSDYIANLTTAPGDENRPSQSADTKSGGFGFRFSKLRKTFHDFRVRHIFPRFPFLEELYGRWRHSLHIRDCQVTNKQRFKPLGARLPLAGRPESARHIDEQSHRG
jgi:hypothetical protein